MRLTLRTLLAYLDDRLPPSNARELGQKIANSPFATELVERIKEVKRKRRLASPDKPQPMIEANLIAEYLDDQLTPEVVAQIEREVLASDAMLAEVAAAHEVLGMLRDPVKVEPRLRDRLYGFDPTGTTEIVRTLGSEAKSGVATSDAAPQWKPLQVKQPSSSKRLPAILIVTLGLIWLAVLAFDSDLFGNKQAATDGASAEVPVAEVIDDKPAPNIPAKEDVDVAQKERLNGEASSAEPKPVGDLTPAASDKPDAANSSVMAKSDTPEPPQPADTESDRDIVSNNNDVAMAAEQPEGEKPAGDVPPSPALVDSATPASETEPAPAYTLQADGRVVMVLNEKLNRWYSLSQIPGGDLVVSTRNAVNCFPLMDGSWFGIQESFPMSIVAESKGWTTRFYGPGLMKLASASTGGLDVFHGRLKLSSDRSLAWNDEQRPEFVLTTGTLNTVLTLQSPDSVVAIEVKPVAAEASGAPTSPAVVGSLVPVIPLDGDLDVQIAVLEGSVTMRAPGADADTTVGKNQRASWKVLDRATFSSLAVQNIESVLTAPAWFFEDDSEDPPELVKVKNRMLETLKGDQDPAEAVLPLLDERNVQSGVMAVKLLSLTRDIDRLLSILYDPRDELIHRAAIDGLSAIANSSSIARTAIRANLETRLPMQEIEPTLMLILGISDAQAADPRVATDLMALLGNDRLATRTLAIYRMEQFTKDRMGFHPEAEPSRRRDAIRRWQRHIDRNAGQLLP